ncbi:palmitoyltransferase [Lobosporangium transversale]|uniref:Synaptobrevin homolog YKT6 n=1 Tax=Lobosporangium transversale TaxID=64571 RepID=A0A1Y2H4N0_9FUNG|nr:synaptobrevin-like protein ykt6 [Lobosporangium transversale]KAF9903245.1 palmitoyltransferase [Lobosporangium transversale]ORZ28673.1 synaptobrevin-like protein ykt6 [Lobosporangium transversale]|eukprot:XP_021886346.1 synaptobrevin-like protein ykt6 [Lobosporangium transversale]
MKLYALFVVRNNVKPAKTVIDAKDLSGFGFFQRSSVGEFMTFMAQTIAEKTQPGQRQSIEESSYVGHVYARSEGVAGVVVTDKEYPTRVAFGLLNKILDEFTSKYPNPALWASPEQIQYPELQQYLVTYQDPKQGDTIMKVQRELDETKIILHKTIESVLERGEKMESLVERSDVLSSQSKMFYKTAKKQNSCCVIC